MRSLLLFLMPYALWGMTLVHGVLLAVFLRKYKATKNILFLLSGLVTAGLFYDALILSLGTVLYRGPLLQALSQVRFISHGGLIPLLFPICAHALTRRKGIVRAVWAVTGILIVLGIAEGFVTVLEPRDVGGVIRYASGEETPSWASAVSSALSYGTVIPLIFVGIAAWVREKTPALFLSGFLMFAFAALGPATGNFDLIFFISMGGEVLMVLFLYVYACQKDKGRKAAGRI